MKIDFIRKIGNTQYEAIVDGVPLLIATRADQSPEQVLTEIFAPRQLNYIEKRLQDYPPIQEQLDLIYHDIDAWRQKIAAIKAKHPK